MLHREIFEILHAVMAILMLFEHFSGKLCLNFFTLILSTGTSPNMMHFFAHFQFIRAQGVRFTLQTKMGGDNPKYLGNELGRLVETPKLFNWEYHTQFMYPKSSTTTQKNERGLNDY